MCEGGRGECAPPCATPALFRYQKPFPTHMRGCEVAEGVSVEEGGRVSIASVCLVPRLLHHHHPTAPLLEPG